MLAEAVALHDVRDAVAFVQATLNASRRLYPPDEREELVAEGLAILCHLASRFEPQRDGYQQAGRFSGFAAKYLRLKLEDAYHRLHPEHQLRTQPDGKRRYEYGDHAVSIDAMTADDPERGGLLADQRAADDAPTVPAIESLLREQLEARLEVAVRVAGSFADGLTSDQDVAEVLGITAEQVREARVDLEPVARRLRTLNQR